MTSPDLPPLPKAAVLCTFMPDDFRYGHVYGHTDATLRAVQLAAYRAGMEAAAQIAQSHLVGGIEGREQEARVYDCEVAAAIRRAAEGGK